MLVSCVRWIVSSISLGAAFCSIALTIALAQLPKGLGDLWPILLPVTLTPHLLAWWILVRPQSTPTLMGISIITSVPFGLILIGLTLIVLPLNLNKPDPGKSAFILLIFGTAIAWVIAVLIGLYFAMDRWMFKDAGRFDLKN